MLWYAAFMLSLLWDHDPYEGILWTITHRFLAENDRMTSDWPSEVHRGKLGTWLNGWRLHSLKSTTPIFLFVGATFPRFVSLISLWLHSCISGSIPKLPDDGLLQMFRSKSTIEDPNSLANSGWDGIGWLIDVWFWESNHVTGRF